MHLKRLELRGFKSFARGIEIGFRPGINVIVGPNGCGKSNIADAIRWVLGESNVRNLRGQRGEDVIFTGTDKKKPLGMATVSMTLDNQDHLINSDYAEINITRRIYRTGESEFLINLSEVRLKDIHSLLAGTGLGKRGYAIIGQGELEQVLDAKPFDRRLIVEEAAGLSGYRQKKDEATAKLQASSQDLIRLEDILGEVRLRKTELEEKANKARVFLELNSEKNDLERRVLAYDLFLFSRELTARESDIMGLTDQLEEARRMKDEEEQALQKLEKLLKELREQTAATKEKKYQLTNGLNQQENESRLSQERIDHARERLDQLQTDIAKHSETMEKLEKDLTVSAGDLEVKEAELREKSREAEDIGREIKVVEERWNQSGIQQEGLKTQLIDLLSMESTYKNQVREKEEYLRKNRQKLELGKAEHQYRQQKIVTSQETLNALEHGLAEGEEALKGLNQEKARLEAERKGMARETIELEKKVVSLSTGVRELQQQVLTLENSIHSHAGISEGVRRLLSAVHNDRRLIPGFLGVMTDLIEVPSGLEVAVEAAAGRSLENVVVKNHDDAKAAIQLLKSRSWGRVTFLPLNMLRNQPVDRSQLESIKKIPGVLGLAADLVKFSPDYQKAAEHMLGRVLIVDNLDTGLKVFKKSSRFRIVTVEGDIINPTGAMTGGKHQGRTSPLQIKALYREKKKEKEVRDKELKKAAGTVEALSLKVKEMDTRLEQLQQRISERAFHQEIQSKERDRVLSELEQIEWEVSQFQAEEGLVVREIATLETELSGIMNNLTNVQSQLTETVKSEEEERSNRDRLARQLDLLRERHTHCCDLVNLSRQELLGRRRGMEQLEAVKESYRATLEDYQEQVTRFTELIEAEGDRIRILQAEMESISQDLLETERLLADLVQSIEANQQQCEELQQAVASHRQQVVALEEKIKHLEIRKARTETEEKNGLLLWEERFAGESASDFWQGMDNRKQRKMREECEVIRQRIEELGPVDVTAIDELNEVNQRFEFLQGQLEDLHKARQSLTRIIEETEAIMNSRFQEFLVVANASFKRTFNGIFQGGEAELLPENHADTWQSGVDIIVKMPGKRRQSLNLLSGGERALTCIAFIFSLLVLNPTPFCLFDEIDSALDDANLGRFTSFLKRLADRMQFIVITHRQGTIEAADNIFGVTMPEQGLSEVYSLTSAEAGSLAG